MAISHRTSRLKLKGSPSVEQLQNGRYKLTVECTTINSREDWYSANKARIFPDFGSLESAVMSIDGLSPRKGEAYEDMRLTEVQSGNRPSRTGEDYIVVLTYETLGSAFVQVKDDTFNYVENGLRRVTRQSIAKVGTEFQKTIGTTSITSQIDGESGVTCILANYEVNDTDSYREVTEVYIQAGTISETEDKVGSQLSIVKETFASTPSTPSGYSIASEQESNVDGISTKRFTFLKNNVQLSQSEDKVGSQLSISQQWFNPSADKTVSGYSLASQNTSDFEGIKTIEYRFLKEDVQLSQSEDEVGSQNSITEEWFKPSASRKTKTTYSLARKEESNVEGIPTERYTFLKDNVVLSVSEDRVGSQLVITNEVFKPSNDAFAGKNVSGVGLSGYSEASREKSNFEGIPTLRYRFLKNNVVLAETEDKVGSQLSLVKEVFNGTPSTPSGYSIANEQVSNVDGIPTRRFTFLKNNVTLSETEDKVGGQLAIVKEVFNGTPSTPSGYSIASEQESNVDGIATKRFTFLKPNILSVAQDFKDGEGRVSVQAFSKTSSEVTAALSEVTSDHKLISQRESDFAGIKTSTFEYQLDESFIQDRELNGLNRIKLIELSASDFSAQTIGAVSTSAPTSGLFLGSQVIDNGGTIKTRQSTWLEAGTLSVSTKNLSEGVKQVTTVFLITEGTTVGPITARSTDNFAGLKTISVTTMQDKLGNALGDNGTSVVCNFTTFSNFTYPGVFSVAESNNGRVANVKVNLTKAPAQAKVYSQVFVFFTKSNVIQASDYKYNGAQGLWSPNNWGAVTVTASGAKSGIQFNASKALRGYRTDSNSFSGTANATFGLASEFNFQGSKKLSDFGPISYSASMNKGPIDPANKNWVLDVKVTSAFEDIDGVPYFKKIIIWTNPIPSQVSGVGGPYR